MKIQSGRKSIALLLLFAMTFFGIFSPRVSAAYEKTANEAMMEEIKISSRLFELLCGKNTDEDILTLGVGGYAIGLKIKEKGLLIKESTLIPALHAGDRIMKLNGDECNSRDVIDAALKNSDGKPIKLEIMRQGELTSLTVTPVFEGGEYKLGISIRSGAVGIGTVSFIDPDTGIFAGLGHGICDGGGELIPIVSGEVKNVTLGSVKKGEAGKPGELTGALGGKNLGKIYKNTELGIFGKLEGIDMAGITVLPVAHHDEVKCAKAQIISTVRGNTAEYYDVEIYDIDYSSSGAKSFKVRVNDPKLIALTGGIVRGMSGSPIIQDGKIIGALTHVMVNDPTSGYGIFIENMLSEMKSR